MSENEEARERRDRASRTTGSASLAISDLVKAAGVDPEQQQDDKGRTLAVRLEEITAAFLQNRVWQQTPPPSAVVKRLKRINKALDALRGTLPRRTAADRTGSEVYSTLTAQAALTAQKPATGDQRLRAAISAVADLKAWTVGATKRTQTNLGRKSGHHGDVATQRLHGDLVGLWVNFWQRVPGISLDGPYVRFVSAYQKAVMDMVSEENTALDPKIKNALSARPQAIRERLRRILGKRVKSRRR